MRFPSFETEWSGMTCDPLMLAFGMQSSNLARARHAACTDKRADGKIEKYNTQNKANFKIPMFRPRSPGSAQAPDPLDKKQCKNRKENSGHLIPQRPPRMGKCSPKSPSKAAAASGCLAHNVAGDRGALVHSARLRGRRFSSGLAPWRCGRLRWMRAFYGSHLLRLLVQSLRSQASADSQSST